MLKRIFSLVVLLSLVSILNINFSSNAIAEITDLVSEAHQWPYNVVAKWNKVTNPAQYRIYVQNKTTGKPVFDVQLNSANLCNGSICEFRKYLTEGVYRVWVQPIYSNNQLGSWYTINSDIVVDTLPPTISINIDIQIDDAVIRINPNVNVTWYQFWDSHTRKFVLIGPNDCRLNPCYYSIHDLTYGTKKLWFRSWGPAGWSSWNVKEINIAPIYWGSVNWEAGGSEIDLNWAHPSPFNSSTTAATWYRLYVYNSDNAISADSGWLRANEICISARCQVGMDAVGLTQEVSVWVGAYYNAVIPISWEKTDFGG